MKNTTYTILLLATFSLTFASCNKEDDTIESLSLTGNYSGTFTVEYINEDSFYNGDTVSNSVSVNFSERNNYESSGNGNIGDFYPAGGKGTYEINDSVINFHESSAWFAHFDKHLVLGGEYKFSKSGNELFLSKNIAEVGTYKYELTKE